MNIDENEVKTGLTKLAENHAIVLHPGTFGIWVAHPFSLAPTLFWVESEGRKWWGNCTWCSLGIAALTKADTRIFTKMSGEKNPLQIDIVGEDRSKGIAGALPGSGQKILGQCGLHLFGNADLSK